MAQPIGPVRSEQLVSAEHIGGKQIGDQENPHETEPLARTVPVVPNKMSKAHLGSLAALLLAASLSMGCKPELMAAPTHPTTSSELGDPERIQLPGLEDDAPEPWRLLPGDVLHLTTTSVEPLDAPNLRVDESGWLHVPMTGPVEVGGLALHEAERRIEQALRHYDRFAKVSLTVTEPAGHRATVVGAVEKPGVYPLPPDTRLAEMIAVAGGSKQGAVEGELHDLADLDAARLVRDGEPLPVSVGEALRGNVRHNVRVRAGDVIYVPSLRGQRVSVLGAVNDAGQLRFYSGMRLSEAVAAAGGAADGVDRKDVRVIRGPLSEPVVYRCDLRALLDGKGGDVELAPGDIVFVTKHWFASTTDVVNRLTPLLAATAIGVGLAKQ